MTRRRGVVLKLEPEPPTIELPSSAAAETIAGLISESVGAVVTTCEARGLVLSWSDREALRCVMRSIVQLRQEREPEFEAWLRNYAGPPPAATFSAGPGVTIPPRPESTEPESMPGLVPETPNGNDDDRQAV